MKPPSRKAVLVISVVAAVIGGGLIHFNNGLIEYYSNVWVSTSISESKSKGGFVREVPVTPMIFRKDSLDIEFNECWVEEQTRIKYSWLFFKNHIGTGRYKLCFTIKKKYPPITWTTYFFVHEDGHSFGLNGSSDSDVFSHSIDKNRSGKVKLSLVRSWQDKRDTGITIYIHPAL